MNNFFNANMDYISFLYGLSFFVLFIFSFLVHRVRKQEHLWKCLSLFALFYCFKDWTDVLDYSYYGADFTFTVIKLVFMFLAFSFLVEFARVETKNASIKKLGYWIYAITLLVVASGYLFGELSGIEILLRSLLGFVGGLWVFAKIVSIYRNKGHVAYGNKWSLYVGLSLLVFAVSQLFGPSGRTLFPLFFTKWPMDVWRTLIVGAASFVLLSYFNYLSGTARIRVYTALAIFGSAVLVGWVVVTINGYTAEEELKNNLLSRVKTTATIINKDDLRMLKGEVSDPKSRSFKDIREKLIAVRKVNRDVRSVYIAGLKNGKIVFYLDSGNTQLKDYADPGDEWKDAPSG
ncbi:MAG: hypothetical protein V1647_06610, partial [Pseudomonadota bacterium]